ncbi:MAG: peptidylprolyl isomerase [Bdellovibrionales bacterium]|nr:peptidylprolyl isomerase [Bdellovibrionales bacterium]
MRFAAKFLSFLFAVGIANASQARTVEEIEVIINDQIITKSDIEAYQKKLKTGGLVDDALLQLRDVDKLRKDRRFLIEHLIDEKLIDSEVKRQNMDATIERVEQEIREVSRRNGISRAQLKEALSRQGVKFSDYQDFIRTSLGRQSLIEKEISSRIRISDEDISSYFLQEKGSDNTQVFEMELAHILFLPQNSGDSAAKQRAEQILSRLRSNPGSFDKMAAQYSEDPNFTQGGILGTFKAGEMLPEIEKAVKNLAPGEISGVIKTPAGYHILKVLRRTLVEDPSLVEDKTRIQNILYQKAFKKQLRLWLDRQRDEAFIRINSDAK